MKWNDHYDLPQSHRRAAAFAFAFRFCFFYFGFCVSFFFGTKQMIITSIRIRVLSRFIFIIFAFLCVYDCEMSMFFSSFRWLSINHKLLFQLAHANFVEFIGLEIPAKNDNQWQTVNVSSAGSEFNDFSFHGFRCRGKRAAFFRIELCFMSHAFFCTNLCNWTIMTEFRDNFC